MPHKTLCGYELPDVRKSLREAIGRRDRRAAHRWAAELVATPGAIGSLWASFWLSCETSMDGNPTFPILLSQKWAELVDTATRLAGDWAAFRNDETVRKTVMDITIRLLDYNRQAIITWPSKEVALYDVSTTLEKVSPPTADSPVVTSVWSRNHDCMELRQLAGHWIEALSRGDIRIALSIVLWTMLPTTKIKCGPRGPPSSRTGAMWYWFSIGSSLLKSLGAHPGWLTMHDVTIEAMTEHYKRWSSTERLKILLFWIIQIKAAMVRSNDTTLWSIKSVQMTVEEIDLPYKEIAVEFSNQGAPVIQAPPVVQAPPAGQKKEPKPTKSKKQESGEAKIMEKINEGDSQIMALLGIS